MNELREQAMKHVMRVEKLKEQHAELEDFYEALMSSSEQDIEIRIGELRGNIYRVRLEQDLGISINKDELKIKLILEIHARKEALENELKKLIGGNE